MKNAIKLFAAMSLAVATMVGTTATVNHVSATVVGQQCGCGKMSCRGGCRARRACGTCNTDCGCVQCPQCDGETCRLELDNSKVKKTCFKVEQKAICIPPIRMPWMKSCPPGTSKTKTVTVLKKHSYECPNCSYKWTLQEPNVGQTGDAAAAQYEPIQNYQPAAPATTSPQRWTPIVPAYIEDQVVPPGR